MTTIDVVPMNGAFLLQLSELFASDADERTLVKELARAVVPAFADWCTVHLLRSDGTIENVAAIGAEDAEIARQLERFSRLAADSPLRAALRADGVQVQTDVVTEHVAIDKTDEEFLRAAAIRSAIVAPIVIRGTAIGAIRFIASNRSARRYGDDAALFARDVACRAALAIDNVRSRAEAVASDQSRDLFLAMLSHEMKTPLTSILGWTRMLRADGPGSDVFEEAVDAIEQSANVQQRLIDDLLDVSRVITGKLHLDFGAVDVRTLLDGAAEVFAPRAKESAQHIRVTAAESLTVYGDQTRLRQVLWNLLSNALKYSPSGGLIELSAAAGEEGVTITVRDTGRGIRADVLPHVFDRFHQATVADRAKHGGLGLGLAIVRNLVELHGGRVEAASAGEGKGSTFSVHLPLHRGTTNIEGESQ
jgi:signal transduction histidine kinase